MDIREIIQWNRLGLRLARLRGALRKEATMDGNYDVRLTLQKGLKGLLDGALAVLLPTLAAYLSNPIAVGAALTQAGLSAPLVAVSVPLVVAGGAMLRNWLKHGGSAER